MTLVPRSSIFYECIDWDNHGSLMKAGWYFLDETWSNCHGPYASFEECEEKLSKYVRYLNGELTREYDNPL